MWSAVCVFHLVPPWCFRLTKVLWLVLWQRTYTFNVTTNALCCVANAFLVIKSNTIPQSYQTISNPVCLLNGAETPLAFPYKSFTCFIVVRLSCHTVSLLFGTCYNMYRTCLSLALYVICRVMQSYLPSQIFWLIELKLMEIECVLIWPPPLAISSPINMSIQWMLQTFSNL